MRLTSEQTREFFAMLHKMFDNAPTRIYYGWPGPIDGIVAVDPDDRTTDAPESIAFMKNTDNDCDLPF